MQRKGKRLPLFPRGLLVDCGLAADHDEAPSCTFGPDGKVEGCSWLGSFSDLEVRVANYGSDYSSAETLKDYDPVVVHVQMPPDDGGDREVLSKQALIGLICLGVLVVLLAFVAAFFFVCFKKEREAHYGLLRINANQDGMVL